MVQEKEKKDGKLDKAQEKVNQGVGKVNNVINSGMDKLFGGGGFNADKPEDIEKARLYLSQTGHYIKNVDANGVPLSEDKLRDSVLAEMDAYSKGMKLSDEDRTKPDKVRSKVFSQLKDETKTDRKALEEEVTYKKGNLLIADLRVQALRDNLKILGMPLADKNPDGTQKSAEQLKTETKEAFIGYVSKHPELSKIKPGEAYQEIALDAKDQQALQAIEAQKKAAEETKKKAEEGAKRKAEEEAKKKAEEEKRKLEEKNKKLPAKKPVPNKKPGARAEIEDNHQAIPGEVDYAALVAEVEKPAGVFLNEDGKPAHSDTGRAAAVAAGKSRES